MARKEANSCVIKFAFIRSNARARGMSYNIDVSGTNENRNDVDILRDPDHVASSSKGFAQNYCANYSLSLIPLTHSENNKLKIVRKTSINMLV